jgi:hypothetical protein
MSGGAVENYRTDSERPEESRKTVENGRTKNVVAVLDENMVVQNETQHDVQRDAPRNCSAFDWDYQFFGVVLVKQITEEHSDQPRWRARDGRKIDIKQL